MNDKYEDDLGFENYCTSLKNHGSTRLNDSVYVISNGYYRDPVTGMANSFLLAATVLDGMAIRRTVRVDQVTSANGDVPFHEGPHWHWISQFEDLDAHEWWDKEQGFLSWHDYCRDPGDYGAPPYMAYDFIQD